MIARSVGPEAEEQNPDQNEHHITPHFREPTLTLFQRERGPFCDFAFPLGVPPGNRASPSIIDYPRVNKAPEEPILSTGWLALPERLICLSFNTHPFDLGQKIT